MKKFFRKIFQFFQSNNTNKYIIELALFLIALFFLFYLATTDVVSNVMGVVVGFLVSSMFLYAFKVLAGWLEDTLKVNDDTEAMYQIYTGSDAYKKTLTSADTSVNFIYDDVISGDEGPFLVEDHPEKHFQLDDFILENYDRIFSAHSNSAKRNFLTIRLDDYDPKTKTIYLSRSTYFNHLLTNRAADFRLFENVSLRDIYEYGPNLTPLAESKMSNHIGINGLVFLEDGRLLLPRRGGSSTISKNQITSSIAVMLNFPNECSKHPENAVITADYLLRSNIIKNLSDRVKILPESIDETQVSIRFLGLGRNFYEVGKPQFYYSVVLHGIDTKKYFRLREEYYEEQKRKNVKDFLDVDKLMYAADLKSFRYIKDTIRFDTYDENNKKSSVTVGYEKSFLCNLWHYEQDQAITPKDISAS